MIVAQLRIFTIFAILVVLLKLPSSFISAQTVNYNGNWSGKTSQDKLISFVALNGTVTSIYIQFVLPDCTMGATSANIPIVNGMFSTSLIDLTVQGTFSSSSSASGTAQFISTAAGCTGVADITWDATLQLPPTNTPTATATATGTATVTPTQTNTPMPTNTPTPTQIGTATSTATLSPTDTPIATPTATPTPIDTTTTLTPFGVSLPLVINQPVLIETPTVTPTPTSTPTPVA